MLATSTRQSAEKSARVDLSEVSARVGEILNRRPAVGFAVGVVRGGRLELFDAHGVADIASKTLITEDTAFRIASITKTFTAIAVMQLCEKGLVQLDAPANNYLRALPIDSRRPLLPPGNGGASAYPYVRCPRGPASLGCAQARLRRKRENGRAATAVG